MLAAACGDDPMPPATMTAPKITSTAVTMATAGEPYSYMVAMSGLPSPTLTATKVPAWLSLEGRLLSGTPAVTDIGMHEVTLTASNGVAPAAVQTFMINVVAGDTPTAPAITSTPVLTAAVGIAYGYAVVATGMPTPTITATGDGGGPLPTWLMFNATNNTLSGTPAATDVGDHDIVLTASNGVSPDATQSFTIVVSANAIAPAFTSNAVTTAIENQVYSYMVTASGTPTPTITATDMPAWLTFNGSLLTGSPAMADLGDHTVTLTASNGVAPDAVQTFTITVMAQPQSAPVFTSTPNAVAVVGSPYSYTATADGVPMPAIAATVIPGWLTFSVNGELLGTPTAADIGSHRVELIADNGVLPAAMQSFSIEVSATPVPPAFTSTPILTATDGVLYSYTATADGAPTPVLSAITLPSWLTFDVMTGVLSGTPETADIGTHTVELAADNGISPAAVQSFAIEVVSGDVGPSITSTPITTANEGALYSYTLTAIGTPVPMLASVTLPPWLIFDAGTGLLSGTPTANDLGPNLVELSATNTVGQATQSFTIIVSGPLVAPAFTSTPVANAVEGQLYSYTVVATGTPPPVLSASLAAGAPLPAWLTFDANTGVLSGTPAAADIGQLQVEISAINGVAPNALQAFTLSVSSANTAPTITSVASTDAQVGARYSYTVVATGGPAPTISVTGLPAWLTFDGATISGTPGDANVGANGPITVTADNGVPPAATEVFTITVAPFGTVALAGSPYIQEFAGTPYGWSVTGQWQFGTATTGLPAVGPPNAIDGNMAATNLTGNYVVNANWQMRTPTFDMTGVSSPRLRFWHWHNFERSTISPFTCYDGGNIKISTDGGTTFVQLAANSVTPAYTCNLAATNTMPGQAAWSAILADWQFVSVDLGPSLAGMPVNQVVLRFDLGSDGSVQRPGWYIDAVHVGDNVQLSFPPAFTSTPPVSTISGDLFSYAPVVTGSAPMTLTASGLAGAPLPSWLTFDSGTGTLSGAPAVTDAGSYTIVITASNGVVRDAVQTFTFTVVPVLTVSAYVFDGDVRTATVVATNVTAGELNNRNNNTTFVAGNPGRAVNSNGFVDAVDPNYYEFTVTPASGNQIMLTALTFDHYRSATGPQNFQVSVVNGTTVTPLTGGAGTVPSPTTWTPAAIPFTGAERGPYIGAVAIRISAWGASAAAGTFRIDNVTLAGTVAARPPTAPTITSSAITTAQVGVPYTYVITADGWTAPTVTVSGLPAWLTYTSATQTISGTPTGLFVGTSANITVTAANSVTPNATQVFAITVAPQAAVAISNGSPLLQGFGPALPTGWAANGGWEFGIPLTGAASVGPPSVLDGDLAATRLAANYAVSVRWSMVSGVYDLTGVTNPVLQFTHWYNFEKSTVSPFTNYDGANIKISTDGGLTFVELNPATVAPAYTGPLSSNTTQMAGQQGWSGILTDWTSVHIDLGANLAAAPLGQVMIRFDMGSDGSAQRPGWYVDNVRIGALADLITPPVITSSPRRSARATVAYSYVATANGIPTPAFTATGPSNGPLPAWLTFNAGTRTLSGTPAAGDVGTHNVELHATNAAGSVTQAFSIRVFDAAATPVFSDTFEGDPTMTQWTIGFTDGTASEWQIGTPTTVGPATCFAGTQCAATNLTGNYAEEVRLSFMQSPVLDLTGLPAPAMRFRQWFSTEATFDGGNIKISTDGGATFSPLTAASVVPAYTGVLDDGSPIEGQLAWSGSGTTWTLVNIDLLADLVSLPTNQVVLRYEFGSDGSVAFPGWYVDDVHIGDLATMP